MSTAPAAATKPAPEPTHACVRCGRPVPLDVSLCEQCNPLGLEQPATSQVHGTVFVAVALAVVFLAVAGRLAISGVGPFRGEVRTVLPAADGLAVTLSVVNEGTKEGTGTCRLTIASRAGIGAAEIVQSPRIAPGARAEFTATTARFGTEAVPLAVECRGP